MALCGTDVVPDVVKVPNGSTVFQKGLINSFGTSIVYFLLLRRHFAATRC